MRMRNVLPMLALLAPALLAGCGDSTVTNLPVPCPQYGILADAADLTDYEPGRQDLAGMVSDARMTGIGGECRRPSRGPAVLRVSVQVRIDVERGPAATGRDVRLPWFLAVADAETGHILDRQAYTQVIPFAANVTRSSGTTHKVELALPVAEGRRASDYKVWVGFQLTPEQLQANRRRGPR